MVREFQFLDLFKGFHKWVDDYMPLDFYEVIGEDKDISGKKMVDIDSNYGLISINNQIEWYQVDLSRLDAMLLTTVAGDLYQKRNYQNASLEEIPSLGKNRDRNNDPFEEYFRRLLIGHPLKSIAYRTWDQEEYLKDVCRQNENFIFYSAVIGFFLL